MTFNEGMQIDTSTTSSSGGRRWRRPRDRHRRRARRTADRRRRAVPRRRPRHGAAAGRREPVRLPGRRGAGLRPQPVQDGQGRQRHRPVPRRRDRQLRRRRVVPAAGRLHPAEGGAVQPAGQHRVRPGDHGRRPVLLPCRQTAYFDTTFFQTLVDQFGSSGGPFAQEYVVAHEFGHHVQNLQGILGRAQQGARRREGNGVRTELQADCYAGVWAHYAAITKQEGTDVTVPGAVVGQGHRRRAVGGVLGWRRPHPAVLDRPGEP